MKTSDSKLRHVLFRRLGIGLCILIGCLALGLYSVVRWTEHQVLTTDNWLAFVSPLPKQPVVYTALGSYVTDQIFTNAPVQQEIAGALPPQAAFLAGPLTDQLKSLVTKVTQRVISSDAFQSVWIAANRTAFNRQLALARGQTTPGASRINQRFSIDLNDIKSQLSSKLGSASSALPTLQSGQGAPLTVTADLRARPRRFRQAVRAIDFLAAVLPYMVIAAFLGALALAYKRRKMLMWLAGLSALVFILELIAIKIGRGQVLGLVQNPANTSAVAYIYDTLLGSFRNMLTNGFILLMIVMLICWAAGPYKWARSLRAAAHLNHLNESHLLIRWRAARQWTRMHRYYLWAGCTLLILIDLAFIASVDGKVLINSLLILLSFIAATYIFGTTPIAKRQATP